MATSRKNTYLMGAHVLISQGFDEAVRAGAAIGCTSLQIFTKSSRQWKAKPISDDAILLFHQALKDVSMPPYAVIAHAGYLINLCSSTAEIRKKSINSLTEELDRCEQLGIKDLVLHPGSRGTLPEQEALTLVADGINTALSKTKTARVLIETMAGQGSSVGNTFEQIATIYDQIDEKKRAGVCIDTCHIFAAGYDIRTKKAYEAVMNQFDKTIGLTKIHAIHLNDSKKPLDSRVDRHENIGQGEIGDQGFAALLNDERFIDIPKILETNQTTDDFMKDHERNLKHCVGLLTQKHKALFVK